MLLNEKVIANLVPQFVRKIYRKKASGFVAHVGLELIFENQESLILHTNPDRNTHLSSVEEFSDGEELFYKSKVEATNNIIGRINERLRTNSKYSVFNNCEHLATEMVTGKATSGQLKTSLLVGAFGTILVGCKPENRKLSTLALAAIGFGLLGLYCEKRSQLSS